jgi:hypothetical protein
MFCVEIPLSRRVVLCRAADAVHGRRIIGPKQIAMLAKAKAGDIESHFSLFCIGSQKVAL